MTDVMTAMQHRPRAPKKTGHCCVCGYEGAIMRSGTLRSHKTRRVRWDGKPYAAEDECLGSGEAPTPFEVLSC